MKTFTYTVHVIPVEEGGYVATVPALPGCNTQAKTLESVVVKAREAIEGFLEMLVSLGENVPIEREPMIVGLSVKIPTTA